MIKLPAFRRKRLFAPSRPLACGVGGWRERGTV